MDALWFWFAQALVQITLSVGVFVLIALVYFVIQYRAALRMRREDRACPHHDWQIVGSYGNTMRCDKCGAVR